MDFSDTKKFPGIFLFVELEKAFDTVEWNFILSKISEVLNFGHYVKKNGTFSVIYNSA